MEWNILERAQGKVSWRKKPVVQDLECEKEFPGGRMGK